MSLTFRIAQGCIPTGAVLQKLVGPPRAGRAGVVCWGRGYNGTEPSLNKRAGALNKLQQLQKLRDAGVLVPEFWQNLPMGAQNYPVLGRLLRHHGGRDIKLFKNSQGRPGIHRDYFCKFVPMATEFRTWVYRKHHLGTYEKRQDYPHLGRFRHSKQRKIGCNRKNGWAFHLMASDSIPAGVRELAAQAVDALGLDFGMVDILKGRDGRLYVLEVNTAGGVEGESRQVIQSLATKIRNWEQRNFPSRNGEQALENPA